ncbi:hypothetical protein G6F16_009984 [Rhizopus arrhizus]|nr:hypothetical protein G6F24_010128 [Rhizopus arrhizus]KAG0783284.1 hypothetical protein G6F22_008744 [Rhizopus arrhizus]KAG0824889.1 hypothetical protein G6F19_010102 [Rhizopus arrhizus]KAG0825097.1 hypothetical protein G6F18_010559 [Rhizopus arrhizus]KAG0865755.1 hypothetical protein G6F16_009984 [Rhizopus arrhizus]
MNVIINQYKQRLVDISGAVEDDVKQYIASFLEDVGNKLTEEQSGLTLSNCSNVNIDSVNYGTQIMSADHSNKKMKIFEEPASPLSSTPLASSPYTCYFLYKIWESEEETEIVVEEDVKLGIWEFWKKVLENMQTQNDIDKYILENLNVIQLGNKIGSESTRKYYPKDLIDKTEMIIKEIPDSFVKDQDFYNRIFDTITLADEQSSNELLAEVYFSIFKSNKPFMKFFHVVVQSFVSGLFIEDSDAYKLEISYNYRIIWSIIDCLSKMIEITRFQPGEVRLLKNLLKCQIQTLLSKVPHDTPNFTNDDFMEVCQAPPLDSGTSMNQFKSNVVEGIADLLVKLPFDPIADKNQFGEVDIQTRYYDPLLSSIVADTTRKVVLRWPNKEDTMTTGIRPDAIVSTLVQRAFGQSLGFGEVKLGGDNTTNHSLCLDTLKLAVLSRNSVLKYDHPILTFQVNGFQLVFYMTQMIHSSFFIMTEIGRIILPEALSCLHSFITLKNIRTLLRVTLLFWHCCYQADSSPSVVAPVSTPSPTSPKVAYPIDTSAFSSSASSHTTQLFQMINNTTSKYRDCSIQYK